MKENNFTVNKDMINILNKMKINCVCLKLINNEEEDIKKYGASINKLDKQLRHCQIIDLVRNNKSEILYTTIEEQLCKGGASALGFCQLPEKIKTGLFYYQELNHFKTLNAAKKTIDSIKFLNPNSTKMVIYSSIENTFYDPDVVLFFANPKQAMLLAQCYLYESGGVINCEFSGKQSFCSDGVARVISQNKPNITVGCSGSRKYTKIKDEELIFSIPWNKMESLYLGIKSIIKDN